MFKLWSKVVYWVLERQKILLVISSKSLDDLGKINNNRHLIITLYGLTRLT